MNLAFFFFNIKLFFYSLAAGLLINSNLVNSGIEYFFECSLVELAGPLSIFFLIIEKLVYFYCLPCIILLFLHWFLLFFLEDKDIIKKDNVDLEKYNLAGLILFKFLGHFEKDKEVIDELLCDFEIATYILNFIETNINLPISAIMDEENARPKASWELEFDLMLSVIDKEEPLLEYLEEIKILEMLAYEKYNEIDSYLQRVKLEKKLKKAKLKEKKKKQQSAEVKLRLEESKQIEIEIEKLEKLKEDVSIKELYKGREIELEKAKKLQEAKLDKLKAAGLFRIRLFARGGPDKEFEKVLKELEEGEIETGGVNSGHTQEKKRIMGFMANQIKKVELKIGESEKKRDHLSATEFRFQLKNLIDDELYYTRIRLESRIFWDFGDIFLELGDVFILENLKTLVSDILYFEKNIQFNLDKLNIFYSLELIFLLYKRFLLLFQISKIMYLGNTQSVLRQLYPSLVLIFLTKGLNSFNPFVKNININSLIIFNENLNKTSYTYSNKVSSRQNHRFHYVDASPGPILISYAIIFCAIGLLMIMHAKTYDPTFIFFGFLMLLLTVFLWWRDIVREGILGHRTTVVGKNLRGGFLSFLVVEMMFFVPFFWAFFYFGLAFCVGIGGEWPGAGITAPFAFGVPMGNTGLLVVSGLCCQFALNAVEKKRAPEIVLGFFVTLVLGFIFLLNQVIEYFTLPFSVADGVFGSSFYLLTGLHGIHVLIGFIFILICWVRYLKKDTVSRVFLGFTFACWYWHFVDIIWIVLYAGVYVGTGIFKQFDGDFANEYAYYLALVVPESIVLRIQPIDFSYSDKHGLYKLMMFIIAIGKEVLIFVIFMLEACINFVIIGLKGSVVLNSDSDVIKDIGEESKNAVFLKEKEIKKVESL